MSVNKVQLANGETIIDISDSTVTPETLAEGVTAHDASGQKITGKMVPGGGTSVQTDWNQMDETAPDFLKNKPFGDFPTVILEEQELPYDPDDGGCVGIMSDAVRVGSVVSVVFDGEHYECEVFASKHFNMFGNQSLLGTGEDTGEPFLATCAGNLVLFFAEGESNHTVKITADVSKRLPDKYASVTKLYINEESKFIYTDIQCTIKATKEDIPDHANYSIAHTVDGGVILYWIPVERCTSSYYGDLIGHKEIACNIGENQMKTYYTAEYIGQ